MRKTLLAFLIILPMIGFSQIEIREENDKLIINNEKVIEKGNILTITDKLLQNIKKLDYDAQPSEAMNIQPRQFSFSFKPINDTSLIGKKAKVLRFSKNNIVVSINMASIYRITLSPELELEDFIIDNLNKKPLNN